MKTSKALLLTATLVASGCGDSDTTGPAQDTGLTLSVFSQPATASLVVGPSLSAAVTQTVGQETLVISRVAVVVRKIKLKRAFATGCDDSATGSDDSCKEFVAGPMILEIPLDGSVTTVTSINVPPDTYDRLEFEIHKPSDDTEADLAFLQANPDFDDVSVRVEGTFDGEPFVFLQDLNEKQEIDLSPSLALADGIPSNITLDVDVLAWFLAPGGSLIDPATANKGGDNENVVENNIKASIEAFEDSDHDGRR